MTGNDLTNFTDLISKYDDYLFSQRNVVSNGFFGNYFFYNLNQAVTTE